MDLGATNSNSDIERSLFAGSADWGVTYGLIERGYRGCNLDREIGLQKDTQGLGFRVSRHQGSLFSDHGRRRGPLLLETLVKDSRVVRLGAWRLRTLPGPGVER